MCINQFKDTKYQELQVAAEKLISIVPKDSPLIVKVNVLNQDIGFIKKDMQPKIKIDTFSFQKYGFFEGKIINVRIVTKVNSFTFVDSEP